jgi:hypothetical protein
MQHAGGLKMKKQGNCRKQFVFIVGSCAHFQSFGVHTNMNAENAIEKLQIIAREKEAQRSEHRQRQEEEAELQRRTKVEEELRKVERKGVLNIQLLVIRSPPRSSSSWECVEGKVYNEKIQFVQMIIQDINIIGTSAIEFLCRSKRCWCVRDKLDQELHK